MRIEFDPAKRDVTISARGLDMADAAEVWDGPHLTFEDDRKAYGEPRFITLGRMADRRLVFVAWTPRGHACRIISMRKANDRENRRYGPRLGR